jgi:hypothetical protein
MRGGAAWAWAGGARLASMYTASGKRIGKRTGKRTGKSGGKSSGRASRRTLEANRVIVFINKF